ncbi:helix-turn-helix domain-containing protein [Streptomyces sp. NPDC001743]|uniref:RICIN domain-containing protein n=1 Tax=Streptomyces sp. NPDC001743 TaxID=3154397 RepID=UPI003327267B
MNTTGGFDPEHADGVEEFVGMMKRLKEVSGLTYRQLEERAEQEGQVLPRSTIADVLRRQALPRPQMLNAFVRACGAGAHADVWLQARNRLARGEGPANRSAEEAPATDHRSSARPSPSEAGHDTEEGAEHSARRSGPGPGAPPKRPRPRAAAPGVWVTLSAVLLVGLVSWLALPDASGRDPAETAPSSQEPAPGWYSIRPARATGLCVTEGREPGGESVAVQRPCPGSTPPYTRLEPLGGGRLFIKWVHPVQGWGCLTVVADGMLAPWDDCRRGRTTQVFTFERVDASGPPGSGPGRVTAYRIRSANDGQCLGVSGTDPGAVVVAGRCAESAAQRFFLAPGSEPAKSELPPASG